MSWRKKQSKQKKKTCIKVIKLEKPEDLLRSRVTVISNVIEFGWNIDIILKLFQLSTKQKRLKCCHFSYFTNLKIALFQVAFLIKTGNRLNRNFRPPVSKWQKKGRRQFTLQTGTIFFMYKPKQNRVSVKLCTFACIKSNNSFVLSRFDAVLKLLVFWPKYKSKVYSMKRTNFWPALFSFTLLVKCM